MQTVAPSAWSRPVRRGRGRAIALLVFALIALWVVAALLRGPTLAADAFAAFESPRAVSATQTTTILPFVVQVQGTVTEATGNWYTSSQVFLIEPLTGWWLNLSQAGVAPSA